MLTRREGLVLYWCEGDKNNNYMVAVTTTDAPILRFFIDWVCQFYNVQRERIKLRLHLWDAMKEEKAKEFWSNAVDIPIKNFTKTYIKLKGSRKKNHEFGVCRAVVNSKHIFNQIMHDIKTTFILT